MKSNEQLKTETIFGNNERGKKVRRALVAVAISASLTIGVAGITGCGAEAQQPNKAIKSVSIEEGARLRSEPYINSTDVKAGDNSNIVETTDNPIVVEANDDIFVEDDSANGEWYGVPTESLKRVDPDLDIKGDKDGIVWVNTQKADVKQSPNKDSFYNSSDITLTK